MQVFIDECALNRVEMVTEIAEKEGIPVVVYHNCHTEVNRHYVDSRLVDDNKESADLAIFNNSDKGDVVVTNDAGLAVMLMGKNVSCIRSDGICYTPKNINSFLSGRHVAKRLRHGGNNSLKIYKETKFMAKCGEEPHHYSFRREFKKLLSLMKETKKG